MLCCSKSLRHSTEEAIQCLGASDALAEDPALAPSTHARQLTPPLTPDPGPLTCSLASSGTCTHTHTAIYIYTHTHNQKSKLEEKYQTMQLEGVFIWAHHPLWQGRHNRRNHRPADLVTSALGKQREGNAGDQLVFSFSSGNPAILVRVAMAVKRRCDQGKAYKRKHFYWGDSLTVSAI